MSNKNYPYLESKKKKKNIKCDRCSKTSDGFQLEWQVSWFRGEDEYENICNNCEDKRLEEERIADEKDRRYWEWRNRKEARKEKNFKNKLESLYTVKYFTPYQWRINGVVDIYPGSHSYHDIRRNERGSIVTGKQIGRAHV